jgi:pentatricopeptide repeat protein
LKPDADISSLQAALDLYTDDFLPNDHGQGWINRHRDLLKNDFGNGAVALSKRCIRSDRVETALPYLIRAMDKTPLLTDVYVHLMRAYLKTGYPSMAIQVFQRAKETFNRELGVDPGPVLVGLARKAKKF